MVEIDGPPAVHGMIRAWLASNSVTDIATAVGKPVLFRVATDERCPVSFMNQRPNIREDAEGGVEREQHRVDDIPVSRRPRLHVVKRGQP